MQHSFLSVVTLCLLCSFSSWEQASAANSTDVMTSHPSPSATTQAVHSNKTREPVATTAVPKATTSSPAGTVTALPVPTTPASAPLHGTGGFDGVSFFGGFVLAIGLAVIGIVVYKVCCNRGGSNYSHF